MGKGGDTFYIPLSFCFQGMETSRAGEEIRPPDQEKGRCCCPAPPDSPWLDTCNMAAFQEEPAQRQGARLQTCHSSAELCSGQQKLSPTRPGFPCFRGVRTSWEVCNNRHPGLVCGVSDSEGVGWGQRVCRSNKP